jgi:cell division septal protein FtsQ
MRHHHTHLHLQDRHDTEEFVDSSEPPEPPRRPLRAPLWKRLRAFCLLLVFLGVMEVGAATLTASHFSVKGVRLAGLSITPQAQVQPIARQLIGHNWLRTNSSAVIRSIQKIPTVDNVRVRRVLGWPLQLKVEVHERQPYAVIGGGSQWWLVDAKGIPYLSLNQPGTSNVDALTGPNFHPQLGRPLPSAQWQKITYLLSTMQRDQQEDQHGFRWDLRRVYFDRNGNVSLRLKDAPHQELLVQLGADQWPVKLERARVALAYLDRTGQRAKVLNLVSYKIPTWIPQSTGKKPDEESGVQGSA